MYSDSDGEYAADRSEAVRRLRDGELRVIFSVDMFNEGLDISELDMVMFLRPTESPVVFLQQLGRGPERAVVRNSSMCWTLSATMGERRSRALPPERQALFQRRGRENGAAGF